MNIDEVRDTLKRCRAKVFGTIVRCRVSVDKKNPEGRSYIQCDYHAPCVKTGREEYFTGRKWYLSEYMTEDEVIKTAFAAFKAAVEHEVMEGFSVDGKILFNPHIDYKELLKISDRETSREIENQQNKR